MTYLIEHPFIVVILVTIIFMTFILSEDLRSIKHNKHRKEIEKKKKQKAMNNKNI